MDPRTPAALAAAHGLDAIGLRAAAILRESGTPLAIDLHGTLARVRSGALEVVDHHAAGAVETLARAIGRDDVVHWIAATREALRRAETVRPTAMD